VAVTVIGWESVIAQGPVPVQPPPLQLASEYPRTAFALSVIAAPMAKEALQVPGQEIAVGLEVTTPGPTVATASVAPALNEATALTSLVTTNVQEGEAPHPGTPLQPPKKNPAAGEALSVTVSPRLNTAEQVPLPEVQLIVAGVEVTVPLPPVETRTVCKVAEPQRPLEHTSPAAQLTTPPQLVQVLPKQTWPLFAPVQSEVSRQSPGLQRCPWLVGRQRNPAPHAASLLQAPHW
jgi:hypothetical protein